MIPVESMIVFVVASVLLGIAPGPDNVFVFIQSCLHGKKAGMVIVLGLCTGLVVHTLAVALGVAVIFQTSVMAFTVLKVVGAVYLMYLAWQAFRATQSHFEHTRMLPQSMGVLYRRGIFMSTTNPKLSLFFLAFLPQFASPEYGRLMPQIFLLGGVFIVISLIVFSVIAVFAGSLGERLFRSPRAQMFLNRVAGTVFGLLAIKLVTMSHGGVH